MNKSRLNYSEVARSELFRRLMAKKKRFIIPLTLFFLAFYITLPVMTSYFDVEPGSGRLDNVGMDLCLFPIYYDVDFVLSLHQEIGRIRCAQRGA